MSVGLAFRAFFAVLTNAKAATKVRLALSSTPSDPSPSLIEAPKAPEPPKQQAVAPKRSDALTLLSTLQREARLIDLIMEPLDGFSDSQIAGAAKDVLRDSRKSLERMFAIEPLATADEGATLDIPANASPSRIRVVGPNAASGTVVHRGWKANKCDVPKWTGQTEDSQVLAPVEVET